jgi:hypothetical protein
LICAFIATTSAVAGRYIAIFPAVIKISTIFIACIFEFIVWGITKDKELHGDITLIIKGFGALDIFLTIKVTIDTAASVLIIVRIRSRGGRGAWRRSGRRGRQRSGLEESIQD